MHVAIDMVHYLVPTRPLPNTRFRSFWRAGELVPEPSDSNSVLAIIFSKRRGNCNSYTWKQNSTSQRVVDGSGTQAQMYNTWPLTPRAKQWFHMVHLSTSLQYLTINPGNTDSDGPKGAKACQGVCAVQLLVHLGQLGSG